MLERVGVCLNNKRWLFLLVTIIGFILLPHNKAYAVEFSINNVQIDAFLQKNGDVIVEEKFTYEFDGEFNGITREIVPKEGAKIINFNAYENKKQLVVERKDDLYKIYRKGDSETISIDITYQIIGGMEKYEDGAQFYWPFFDKRNESDYLNLTITIHPPRETNDVLALGYDTAYKKEKILEDGSVIFQMRTVLSGENGDIRVVYDKNLFTTLESKEGTIRNKVLSEIERLKIEEQKYIETRSSLKNIGNVFLPIFFIFITLLILGNWWQFSSRKKDILLHIKRTTFNIPEDVLSIPATIFFTKPTAQIDEVLTAGLLDLIRKGHIQEESDEKFILVNPNVKHNHEGMLINFLFDKIGNGKEFYLNNLVEFSQNQLNVETYRNFIMNWRSLISNEIKQNALYKKTAGFRWFIAILGVILLVLSIIFIVYDLFSQFFLAFIGSLVSIGFALVYHPKSDQGLELYYKWQKHLKSLDYLNDIIWENLTEDEKNRTIAYSIAFKENFKRSLEPLLKVDNNRVNHSFYSNPLLTLYYFNLANTQMDKYSSNSSTSSSSGGGVGGGGGGSGAF